MKQKDYAVTVLLLEEEGEEKLLLEVRSNQLRRQPGEICLPGGGIGRKADGSLETPEEAALRECGEELLVEKNMIRMEGHLPGIPAPDGGTVYPFFGRLLSYDGTFRREEVSEILRIPVSFFMETEPERYPVDLVTVPREGFPYERIPGGRDYPFQKKEREILFYDYRGNTIWGLTAAVIDSFIRDRKRKGRKTDDPENL